MSDEEALPTSTSPLPTPRREGKEPMSDDLLASSTGDVELTQEPVIETPGTAALSSSHAGVGNEELLQRMLVQQNHMMEKMTEQVSALVMSLTTSPDASASKIPSMHSSSDWRNIGKETASDTLPPPPWLPKLPQQPGTVSTQTSIDQLLSKDHQSHVEVHCPKQALVW
jgi:hypothetical protein